MIEKQKKNINPKSLENIHPREKGNPAPKKFMQINIYGYQEYLDCMAYIKHMNRSQYILSLIKKDMEQNAVLYEELKKLPEFKNLKADD